MSIKFKAAGAIAATMMMAGTASAGCNSGSYCTASSSPSMSAHSSLSSTSHSSHYSTSYGTSGSSYSTSSYPSGSISNEYAGGDVEIFGFSGELPGLGANESLQATNCPVNVYNPEGAKVLGCYNVVKPTVKYVPQTYTYATFYQVVRPVIYVRYPVPVGVPVYSACCNVRTVYRCKPGGSSRYGTANYGGGWGCR